jgi:hypothetical protein
MGKPRHGIFRKPGKNSLRSNSLPSFQKTPWCDGNDDQGKKNDFLSFRKMVGNATEF